MKKVVTIMILCIVLTACNLTSATGSENQSELSNIKENGMFYQREEKIANNKEFDKGSKIEDIKISQNKISDLTVVGKIWGYLKYYHPNVAKGEYNWDYELFRVLDKILEVENSIDRNKILLDWVESQGKYEIDKGDKKLTGEIRMIPDLKWIEDSGLGDDLILELNNIRNAKRTGKNFYVSLVKRVGNPDFKNEKIYSDQSNPDLGFRLLGLYRYWNIIEYYFPYKDLIGEDWDNVLIEFIPKFIEASSQVEYKLSCLELIARIHDTHANIYGDVDLENYFGKYLAPIKVDFIENKAIVTDYFNYELGEKTGLKIGDIIISINNKSIDEIIEDKTKYTPASNYPTLLRNISSSLLESRELFLNIEFMRDNKIEKVKIECYDQSLFTEYYQKQNQRESFKIIDSDIAYIYPGTIKNSDLSRIMKEVEDTKGLIIDFRSYPSDFIVFTLGKYLMPESTKFVKFSNGSITEPGLFTMGKELAVGRKNHKYYKNKIVIIIDETTQSSAEYHTMAFRTAPRATVIGSTTAAADGNISRFYLPGGVQTVITGIGVYYPDGTETQRVGIIPDVEIRPTIGGIKAGKDELLEKAIEIINEEQ